MNRDFVTGAIENDRYPKAKRLVDRFQDEIIRELENTCRDVIATAPELFPEDPEFDENIFSNDSETLRVEVPLARELRTDDGTEQLEFYIAVEWTEPEDRNEPYADGSALCVAHYKIRENDPKGYQRVKELTEADGSWNIRFAPDPHNEDRGVYYIPVTSGEELAAALSELADHFAEYGHEFGDAVK
jgi:hypothetical protein